MKHLLLVCLLISFSSFSQIQIGNNIYGEDTGDRYGTSVSLSNDGNIVAIGARLNDGNGTDSGHVRIHEYINGIWTQIGSDIDGIEEGDQLGFSVSLSGSGNIVAIGAIPNGISYLDAYTRIYENINGEWTQIGADIVDEIGVHFSGWSLSLSDDGNIVAIGAPGTSSAGVSTYGGHVRIYENISGEWTQIGSGIDGETTNDNFGISVSLSNDGNIIAIGARFKDDNGTDSGQVSIYQNINGIWTQIGTDINGEAVEDNSGFSVSLSGSGNIVAIGAPFNDGVNGSNSGHVRVYSNSGSGWIQVGQDIDGETVGDNSGYSVSLSDDGNIVAIGAPFNKSNATGQVRIYKNISGVWTKIGFDIDGNAAYDLLGYSVGLSSNGNIVAIGALFDNTNNSGYVRVYDLNAVLSTKSFEKGYFSFYPNPVKDFLNIDLNKGLELKQVNIYTLEGRYLYSVKNKKVEVKNLSSGMYVFEVETNQGKSAKKIVIE